MSKKKKAPWFKIYASSRSGLEAIDSAKLGDALKATLQYFDTGGDPAIAAGITDEVTRIAFNFLRSGADESLKDFADRIADGRRGADARKEKAQQTETEQRLFEQYGGDEPTPAAPTSFKAG